MRKADSNWREQLKKAGLAVRRRLSERQGTSMIEVLVAITVVLLMLGIFTRVMSSAVHMLSVSNEILEKTEKFNTEYYKTESYAARTKVMTGLALQIDRAKTDPLNHADDISPIKLSEKSAILVISSDWDTGYRMFSVQAGYYTLLDGGTGEGGSGGGGETPPPETTPPEETTKPEETTSPSVSGGGSEGTVTPPENFPEELSIKSGDGYWPEDEKSELFDENGYYQPAAIGFFEWNDAYYVLTGDWWKLDRNSWKSPEQINSEWGIVVKWSGRAFTAEEFQSAQLGQGQLKRGDLCKGRNESGKEVWFIYTNGSGWGILPPDGSNWYEIPGQ